MQLQKCYLSNLQRSILSLILLNYWNFQEANFIVRTPIILIFIYFYVQLVHFIFLFLRFKAQFWLLKKYLNRAPSSVHLFKLKLRSNWKFLIFSPNCAEKSKTMYTTGANNRRKFFWSSRHSCFGLAGHKCSPTENTSIRLWILLMIDEFFVLGVFGVSIFARDILKSLKVISRVVLFRSKKLSERKGEDLPHC